MMVFFFKLLWYYFCSMGGPIHIIFSKFKSILKVNMYLETCCSSFMLPWSSPPNFHVYYLHIFWVQVYIRKCTLVTPHPLLLLSTEMVVAPTETHSDNPPGPSSSFLDEGSDDEDNSCDEGGEVRQAKISVCNLTTTFMCHNH